MTTTIITLLSVAVVLLVLLLAVLVWRNIRQGDEPVSYTHLTLPTNREV